MEEYEPALPTPISVEYLLTRTEDEEFDRTLKGQNNIGETIAAFGTSHGGILLVGQDDLKRGGEVKGINETEFMGEYANARQNVSPPLHVRVECVDYQDKKLAIIQVQHAGTLRPCAYKGIYYGRKGDSSVKLSPREVQDYHLRYGRANPEDMPTHAKIEDVDGAELEVYSTLLKKSKSNILKSVSSDKGFLTARGVIILAKRPEDFLEGAFVELQRYDNMMGSPPVPVGSPIRISKPARQAIEKTVRSIEQFLPISRWYNGARMIQGPAVPVSVIREAVTNAIAHRNYSSHEHIRVRVYEDGFDISNPASITPRMWKEILSTQAPYHPNEGIYTFLNPALLYEGRGEGIWKIREELDKLGKVAPEFVVIGELPSTFYLRISLSPSRKKDARMRKLMKLLSHKSEITTSEVMKVLNVSRVTAITLLNKLVEQNMLEHTGSARSSKYLVTFNLRQSKL